MSIGNFIGTYLGIKLVNGKLKPKFGIAGIFAMVFMIIILVFCIVIFIDGLINFNMEHILVSLAGIVACIYLILITPYAQNPNNYYIEFQQENSLENFKLKYKNKLVNIKYKIDKEGKILFAKNSNKLDCISYEDGSKMSNFTKYRILNYFTKWLKDNKLLSSEVTTTFEKL